MTAILNALRWDVIVQARNGFYWASARANSTVWVPAILVISLLQITTFFFVAGLMLLERDEGMLNALAVSPLSPSGYLVMRTVSLTGLAAAETIAIVWIGFGTSGSWSLILGGTAALGVSIPVSARVSRPLQFVAGIFPTYWSTSARIGAEKPATIGRCAPCGRRRQVNSTVSISWSGPSFRDWHSSWSHGVSTGGCCDEVERTPAVGNVAARWNTVERLNPENRPARADDAIPLGAD